MTETPQQPTDIEVITRQQQPDGKILVHHFYSKKDTVTNVTVHPKPYGAKMELTINVLDDTRSSVEYEPVTKGDLKEPQPGETWMHSKSTAFVTILHRGRMQYMPPEGATSIDMAEVVVYRHDDNVWTRLLSEFMDRFRWVREHSK